MSNKVHAIALSRVSSDEQLKNDSLPRQASMILKEADRLGAVIPEGYWFSGSVSSKRGVNLKRKDLLEIIKLCKKDKLVKFVILDEPDRFMRSSDEAIYFEVTFRTIGVKVWYACDPMLNTGDLPAKLLRFTKYWVAEGSNEERQRKAINGQTRALEQGRYPFHPKPGYRRGYVKSIPEIDEKRGPALKIALEQIAAGVLSPTQALKELNRSDFAVGRVPYKMDKFRKIATDPFYAGILEVDKQIKVRNVNGAHVALISLESHKKILHVFNSKPKNQLGPLKNGNPKYPLNNIVHCDKCKDKPRNTVVGFDHTNGKPNSKVYQRYRCRGCGAYLKRDELHDMVMQHFEANSISPDGQKFLVSAFKTIWKQKEGDMQTEKIRLENRLTALRETIAEQVKAAIDPMNISIKAEIMDSIRISKEEASELEYRIGNVQASAGAEQERFLKFALAWIDDISSNFLSIDLSKDNRLRCKQIVFPADFHLDKNQKVYTPEISPLITLGTNKKDLPMNEKSSMVRVRRL